MLVNFFVCCFRVFRVQDGCTFISLKLLSQRVGWKMIYMANQSHLGESLLQAQWYAANQNELYNVHGLY